MDKKIDQFDLPLGITERHEVNLPKQKVEIPIRSKGVPRRNRPHPHFAFERSQEPAHYPKEGK